MDELVRGICDDLKSAKNENCRMFHPLDFVGELLGSIDSRDFCPFGLVHPNAVEHRRELVSVFCVVDLLGVGSKHIHPILLESKRNVLRELTYEKKENFKYRFEA